MTEDSNPKRGDSSSALQFEAICGEYRTSLEQGAAISLASLVARVPEQRSLELLKRLACINVEFCAEFGMEVDLNPFVNEFQLGHEFVQHVVDHAKQVQQRLTDSQASKTQPVRYSSPTVPDGAIQPPAEGQTDSWRPQAAAEMSEPSSGRFRVGQRFGRYVLNRKLDEGGMGEVWQAFDTHFEAIVALKFPLIEPNQDADSLAQFQKEAQALAKLFHPNICRIFDVDSVDGQWYIAMAYIQGRALDYEQGRSLRDVLDIVRTVALALHEAHLKGIIHRDVKPSNVMLDNDRTPIVLDFGLAVSEQDLDDEQLALNGGTMRFMAPEQLLDQPDAVSVLSDIYGLGALLYSLMTNQLIYQQVSSVKELVEFLADPETTPAPPSEFRAEIPPSLDAICLKALSHSREERFASMQEFAEAIQHLLESDITKRAAIHRDFVRFEFMGQHRIAPEDNRWQDRLFLDTGNRLTDGVIDHHQMGELQTCATHLVLEKRELVLAALKPWRRNTEFFTIITHAKPDLDCVCATYLSLKLLSGEAIGPGIQCLVNYVQAIDQGFPAITSQNPFSLYAAFTQRAHSLSDRLWTSPDDCFRQIMLDGIAIVEFVVKRLDEMLRQADPDEVNVRDIDAFLTPGIFRPLDRKEIMDDARTYERQIRSTACQPYMDMVTLPNKQGHAVAVPFLFIRNVQNKGAEDYCLFFRDWARSDSESCEASHGFVGLCIHSQNDVGRHCIISVRPADQVHLMGLGEYLDEWETQIRIKELGFDNRVTDPDTKQPLPNRPGYNNSDPWYDGRGHHFTIIGSPISGTMMTEDQIEHLVLAYYT